MTASRDPLPPHPPRALTEEETALLLARDIPAHLATLDAAGFPRITPIWFVFAEGAFYMTSVAGKCHLADLARDPRAAICIDGEEHVSVAGLRRNRQVKGRGRAELFADEGGTWTRRITHKYIAGAEGEALAQCRAAQPRIVIRLSPERLIAIGTLGTPPSDEQRMPAAP
jgi:nitroimidazol reductase NimA-like FMN-containing flavoprotein (pyridoxamine 5'-phosphate oxidase superfamily)